LQKQLSEVEDAMDLAFKEESQDQDAALEHKLAARRRKRECAIGMDRAVRARHVQERIKFQLDQKNDFSEKRKELTRKALEGIVAKMQLEKAPEEVPGAIDRLLDEKHQKELEDLLLKLFEQKAVELKEEIVALMEEKVAKQQLLKRQAADRGAGISAIINGGKATTAEVSRLNRQKNELESNLKRALADNEAEYKKLENGLLKEVNARTIEREADSLDELTTEQLNERKEIFNKFLPDTLITDLNGRLDGKEAAELAAFKVALMKDREERLNKVQGQANELDKDISADKQAISKLSAVEQILRDKELADKKRERAERAANAAKVDSKDLVQKLRDEYEE